MDFADSAAHNEEVFRTINERIEEGAKQHGVEQPLPFHCECADDACVEKIELAPTEAPYLLERGEVGHSR